MGLIPRRVRRVLPVVAAFAALAGTSPGLAAGSPVPGHGRQWRQSRLVPGDLLVATSQYVNDSGIVAGTTQLPPGCSPASGAYDPCVTAVAAGDYPYVFNNASADGSFGVTSPIQLLELTPDGRYIGSIEVPNSTERGVTSSTNQLVTSFSSKSELALNLSPNDSDVTFVGYKAAVDTVDVSNANTPGDIDPTSAVPGAYYRVVAQLGADGRFHFTETNAFSGDNGRAAVTVKVDGKSYIYATGNAGNGANPEPAQVVTGAGAQLIQPSKLPESEQVVPQPTPVGSFNITDLGDPADKAGKDDNFRGLAEYDNVLYYTKGSGSNGVDTVYFLDTTGKACPDGVGTPVQGAPLPTSSDLTYSTDDPSLGLTAKNPGLEPENMCILKGFPTTLAKDATDSSAYPFGLWFANPDTLYVADEGSGDNTNTTFTSTSNGSYGAAAASTTAGLQKWVFDRQSGAWQLAYVLQSGLKLGQPYVVPGYPTGINSGTGGTDLPWAPATDGLRNITGQVNRNGTVTIWAETSTVSGGGDQGADPNKLVAITDELGATALPSWEQFRTVVPARDGVVVRGVSFTPGTGHHVGHSGR